MGRLSRADPEAGRGRSVAFAKGKKPDERFSLGRKSPRPVGSPDGRCGWRDRRRGCAGPAFVPGPAESQETRRWLEHRLLRFRFAQPGRRGLAAASIARTQSKVENANCRDTVTGLAL